MTQLLKKLNFKHHEEILIINHPKEFKNEMQAMKSYTVIKTNINDCNEIVFVLTFVKTKLEIDKITPQICKKLKGDGIVWFAYPKGTSKKYKVEINRDTGWSILEDSGFEGVRSVAIDEDWSASRFRRVEYVKKRHT